MFAIASHSRTMRLGMIGIMMLPTCLIDACRQVPESTASRPSQHWDPVNAPDRLGVPMMLYSDLVQPEAVRGALDPKPWAEAHWAFQSKNIARRYLTGENFNSFEAQRADARATGDTHLLSPAEKYDIATANDFRLTAESWHKFRSLNALYGDGKWGWMGICSGWAPASFSEPMPHHAVVVPTDAGDEVIFFPGDLRVLMAKAYDVARMDSPLRSLGGRCDLSMTNVPRDDHGRPVDGYFGGDRETFTIVRDDSLTRGVLAIAPHRDAKGIRWLALPEPKSLGRTERFFLYDDYEALKADLAARKIGERAAEPTQRSVHLTRSCRDINPASLHLTLVHHLAEGQPKKRGLVLELSRQEMVWNFPVWGYETSIEAPVSIAELDAKASAYRSPDATHVAQVKTAVIYVPSPRSPAPFYPDEPSYAIDWDDVLNSRGQYAIRELSYTLEFDANGYLVGGEWRSPLNADANERIPDFLWYPTGHPTDETKSGNPAPVRYSVLKKLWACSLAEPNEVRDFAMPGVPRELPVVVCPL